MTTDKMQVNLRAVILDILLELNKPEAMSHTVLSAALKKYQYCTKSERSFITRIVLGTVERRIELDYIIDAFSKTPADKMKPLIRALMEMSVYQLKYVNNVPASAVCNEAVKLASKRGFVTLKGFVNAVLRNIASNLDSVEYPDKIKEYNKYLSVVYSMPEWIVDMWRKNYPDMDIEQALGALNKERSTYIRCNTSKVSMDELKKHLEAQNINVYNVDGEMSQYAYKIAGYDYIEDIESFFNGEFQVQDISSMMAGEGNLIKSADYIVDVCAAPGGKTINAALKATEGTVDARDVSDAKVSLIEDNIDRLGINNIRTKVWDATVKDESVIGRADVVIADLPCSGLGIMGRKPDIRYSVTEKKIESLMKLQRDILSVVWEYTKPGGYLIYSTCTLTEAENTGNVRWFCENYPYEQVQEPITIYPGAEYTDGFFIARLRRKPD